MPFPVLFIGAAAVSAGLFGAGKTVKAVVDSTKASNINNIVNANVKNAAEKLEMERVQVGASLENLGNLKLNILQHNVMDFLESFEQIKNVDNQSPTDNSDIRYSRVADPEEIKRLNNEETVTVYRAMQVIDGELYPPMAAKVKDETGKKLKEILSELKR